MVTAQRLDQIYKDTGIFNRIYVSIKFRIFPHLKLEELIPKKGKIADLGCGFGVFTNIVAFCSSERIIEGSDIDRRKINVAEKTIGNRKNIKFFVSAVQDLNGSDFDTITINDLLYLIPFEQQEQILRNCLKKLRKDGLLLLKEMDTKPYWKYLLNMAQETLLVRVLRFTKGGSFFFRNCSEYKSLLSRIGFEVKVIHLDKGKVYPHIVYICKKRDKINKKR